MAGSLVWREYTTDGGNQFSIKIDKSNADCFNGINNEILCLPRTVNHSPLLRGIRPRIIHCYKEFLPSKKRSFIVGNLLAYRSIDLIRGEVYIQAPRLDDGTAISGGSWIVTGYVGESCSVPGYYGNYDTGLRDGTGI